MLTKSFAAGDTILTEGDPGDRAFLIVSGSVEVSVGEGARAKVLGALKEGEVFGEMSLIEPGPRSATVKALSDTECLTTSYDEFIASIQSNPEKAVEFMKTLVRRLRAMNERIAAMDPKKRGLRDIFRDWQKAGEKDDTEYNPLTYWPLWV